MAFHYRVEVDVSANEELSEDQLSEAFTAETWGLVDHMRGPAKTKLVRAWPRRGTEFKGK